MECGSYSINEYGSIIAEGEHYKNIKIEKGKTFEVNTIDGEEDINLQVYVTDKENRIAKVETDGKEVRIEGQSESTGQSETTGQSESTGRTENTTQSENTGNSEITSVGSTTPTGSGLYSAGQVSVTPTATVSETTPEKTKTHVTANSVKGIDPYTGATGTIDTFANGTATVLSVDNALKLTGVVTYDGLNYVITRFSTNSFKKVTKEKIVIDLKTSGNTQKVILMPKTFKGSGVKTLSLKLTSADQIGFKKGALTGSKIEKVAVYGLTKPEFNRVKRKIKASGYTGKVVRK